MQHVHVKNLEKYHPGYRDRKLQWCKAYFTMLNADPEFELISDETDKWRFMSFVMLELQIQKPVPLDPTYLTRKGFNLKTRPIALTLNMLHNFLEYVSVPLRREDIDKEEDKSKTPVTKEAVTSKSRPKDLQDVIDYMKNQELANKFWDHFTANGWKVGGKAPMVDWMAAARNFMRNSPQRAPLATKKAILNCFICKKDIESKYFSSHFEEHKREKKNEQQPKLAEMLDKLVAEKGV